MILNHLQSLDPLKMVSHIRKIDLGRDPLSKPGDIFPSLYHFLLVDHGTKYPETYPTTEYHKRICFLQNYTKSHRNHKTRIALDSLQEKTRIEGDLKRLVSLAESNSVITTLAILKGRIPPCFELVGEYDFGVVGRV